MSLKLKEKMIFDPRSICEPNPHNSPILQVTSYKYLGVFIDYSLTWHIHVEYLCTRLQQRMYFLRRLRFYGVNSKLLFLFFKMILESVVRYSMLWDSFSSA